MKCSKPYTKRKRKIKKKNKKRKYKRERKEHCQRDIGRNKNLLIVAHYQDYESFCKTKVEK